jgi:hypothetical protein
MYPRVAPRNELAIQPDEALALVVGDDSHRTFLP